MKNFIEKKIADWDHEESRQTNLRLQFLERQLYSSYEVTSPPNPNFWERLRGWIENAKGDPKKEIQLFNSIGDLFFVGPNEFKELYKQAYNGVIARWLIEKENIQLTDPDAQKKLIEATKLTWFCPITDSMNINSFYHVNGILGGIDYRPQWQSIVKFPNRPEIENYIRERGIKYLVLLEDFVGGGSQISDSVTFATTFSNQVSTLLVPLIICPKGASFLSQRSQVEDFDVSPVLQLPEQVFVSEFPNTSESTRLSSLRDLANATYSDVTNGQQPGEIDSSTGHEKKPYYPLGWERTGGLIIMYTNTPDNCLPMFHWKSETWEPIFPRHSRI